VVGGYGVRGVLATRRFFFKSWVGCLVQVGFKNKCIVTSMLRYLQRCLMDEHQVAPY